MTALTTDQLTAATSPGYPTCQWDLEDTACTRHARWALRLMCCGAHQVICTHHLRALRNAFRDEDVELVCTSCESSITARDVHVTPL